MQYASTYTVTGLTSDGFINVGNLIGTANTALGLYPVAVGGASYRNYLLALAQAMQGVDDNNTFVQLSGSTLAALEAVYASGLVS